MRICEEVCELSAEGDEGVKVGPHSMPILMNVLISSIKKEKKKR